MGIFVPVNPAAKEGGPVALSLPPKPIPLPLSGMLSPSAFITNLWLSVKICSRGLTRKELLLIARSFPRSELGCGPSQSVVLRLKRPACTALISPTGCLSVMGGVTKEQALWQAFRVAYKLKYRLLWRYVDDEALGSPGTRLSGGCRKAATEFVCHSDIDFDPKASSVLQLVCRLDLGGSFRPDVSAILDHPQLRTFTIDTKDGVAVRIPNMQEAQSCASLADSEYDGENDLFAFDAETGSPARGRRAARAKGPTCLIFKTGKILVLGCRSPEEINAAVDFVWPALVGL